MRVLIISIILGFAALQPVAHAAEPTAGAANAVEAAVAARQAGRFDDATQLLLEHIGRNPRDVRALHELGVLYAIHGQLGDAVARFDAALAIDPQAGTTRRALAEVLRADGRCGIALPHYQTLLLADPADQTAWRGVVLCQHAIGKKDAALQACADIGQRFAGTAFATWATERATQIRALASAGGVTPEQADAEGAALFGERRYGEASVWLGKAFDLAPNADRAYRMALAQLGSGEPLAALASLGRGLQLAPHHVASLSAWPTVAKAVRVAGQGGMEIAFARQDRTPVQMVAHALSEGDLVLARQLLQNALDVQQKSTGPAAAQGGAVLAVLNGEVLLREGKLAQAVQAFQDALAQRPKYPPARKGLAAVYVLQGKYRDARDLAGLPPPANADQGAEDLQRYVALRRAELMHQLQMADDPGLKPLPALVDQVIGSAPPPPPAPPPAPEPVAKPVKAKAKVKSKSTGRSR